MMKKSFGALDWIGLKESISYLIELSRSFQTFTPLYVNVL